MANKRISMEAAAKRFLGKLQTEDYGHTITVKWGAAPGAISTVLSGDRETFDITCRKCGTVVAPYRNFVNADGTIGATKVSEVNFHLWEQRPKETITTDAYLVMSVEMRRGDDTEFWVAHASDTDFREGIGKVMHDWYQRSAFKWQSFRKDSRGTWRYLGVFATEMEAVGSCSAFERNYTLKGYKVTLHHRNTDFGVIPPAATVKISVKSLINEYKGLRAAATPIEVKQWLDKVADALTNMDLLEALHEEVKVRFAESLIL